MAEDDGVEPYSLSRATRLAVGGHSTVTSSSKCDPDVIGFLPPPSLRCVALCCPALPTPRPPQEERGNRRGAPVFATWSSVP